MGMRKIAVAAAMLLVAAVILFPGCKGEQGPAGPAGATTVTNLEGFAPDIKCATCHDPNQDSTYHLLGREQQWAQSVHAIGGNYDRSTTPCSGCHTTEGFIQRMNNLTVTNQSEPTPPGCFACHSPHARGDFSLRNITPVTLVSNISGVASPVFDYGNGNLCVQCHQPRTMSPLMPGSPAATDSVVITNSRWYSHYGVQSQMLMGEGGFKFPDFTYSGNSNHTANAGIKQEGCPTCHMAEQAGIVDAGGHTMKFEEASGSDLLASCNQAGCHGGGMTQDVFDGIQGDLQANLDTLQSLLVARGWIDTTSSIQLPGGKLVIKPAIKAGALYNYFFVMHDKSMGVHNHQYATDLVRSSIAELRKP